MKERDDIEKRTIVKNDKPNYRKHESKNPIELIFYKNGVMALTDNNKDYWEQRSIYLYPQQIEQLRKIFLFSK